MRKTTLLLAAAGIVLSVGCDAPTSPKRAHVQLNGPWAVMPQAIDAPPNCNLQIASNRFAHPVFPWSRTSESVFLASGTLHIEPFGPVDDGFAAPCRLTPPWEFEVTGRLVGGGQNYVFPKIHGQFSNGYWFIATSLPDGIHGWLLMVCNPESWLEEDVVPGHTFPEICTENRWNLGGPPSVAEGEFMTLKVTADGMHLRLFAKHAGLGDFVLAHEVPFMTTGLSVTRVGASQPWDAAVEVTRLNASEHPRR